MGACAFDDVLSVALLRIFAAYFNPFTSEKTSKVMNWLHTREYVMETYGLFSDVFGAMFSNESLAVRIRPRSCAPHWFVAFEMRWSFITGLLLLLPRGVGVLSALGALTYMGISTSRVGATRFEPIPFEPTLEAYLFATVLSRYSRSACQGSTYERMGGAVMCIVVPLLLYFNEPESFFATTLLPVLIGVPLLRFARQIPLKSPAALSQLADMCTFANLIAPCTIGLINAVHLESSETRGWPLVYRCSLYMGATFSICIISKYLVQQPAMSLLALLEHGASNLWRKCTRLECTPHTKML